LSAPGQRTGGPAAGRRICVGVGPPLAAVPAGGGQQSVLLGLGDQFPLAVVELSQLQIWVEEHLGLRIARFR